MFFFDMYKCIFVLITAQVINAAPGDDSFMYVDGKRSSGNNFVWQTSKQPVQHYNWATGEPDNKLGIQDCLLISDTGFLYDTHCNRRLRAICQYP